MTPETPLAERLAAVTVALEGLSRSVASRAENGSQAVDAQPDGFVQGSFADASTRWGVADEDTFGLTEEGLELLNGDDDENPEEMPPFPPRIPEPPGELPAFLDHRLTAIENRLGLVHRLVDRLEHRCDAQLSRIAELEAHLAAAGVNGSAHVKRLESLEAWRELEAGS